MAQRPSAVLLAAAERLDPQKGVSGADCSKPRTSEVCASGFGPSHDRRSRPGRLLDGGMAPDPGSWCRDPDSSARLRGGDSRSLGFWEAHHRWRDFRLRGRIYLDRSTRRRPPAHQHWRSRPCLGRCIRRRACSRVHGHWRASSPAVGGAATWSHRLTQRCPAGAAPRRIERGSLRGIEPERRSRRPRQGPQLSASAVRRKSNAAQTQVFARWSARGGMAVSGWPGPHRDLRSRCRTIPWLSAQSVGPRLLRETPRLSAGPMHGDHLVFVFLGVAFAAVGLHLAVYSRRRSGVFRRFAAARGYPHTERDDGSLERQLDRAFEISEPGCARAFSQVRDIVCLPIGKLFRAVELIDLNPHASAESPHHARAAVVFPGTPEWSGVFHVTSDLRVHQRYPREPDPATDRLPGLLRQVGIALPPHPLSLTFMRGQGLAYLEPTLTGSITETHLTYLSDLAERFAHHFSGSPATSVAPRDGAV